MAGTGAGTGWGTAQLIESDNSGSAFEPRIVIDPNSNALVVWQQDVGVETPNNIWANRYVAGTGAGTGWGTARLMETVAGDAYGQGVAIDSNGNAFAFWHQDDGTRYDINIAKFE